MDLDQARAHHPQLVPSARAHVLVHGDSAVGRANAWLAVKITRGVAATMEHFVEVRLHPLERANEAMVELRDRPIRGATVLTVGVQPADVDAPGKVERDAAGTAERSHAGNAAFGHAPSGRARW